MSQELFESAAYVSSLLSKGFSRSFQAKASALGFSPGQYPILVTLWDGDGITQRELVSKLEIEQATIANTLSRMERDGLIERRKHPEDKRAQLLFLTEKAHAMKADALQAAREADDALFKGFRRFERELMMEYMRWVVENARRLEEGEADENIDVTQFKQIPLEDNLG